MADGILSTVKEKLGILEDYTHFDSEIITDINTVFVILSQLGVGPDEPFVISGYGERWDDFIEEGVDEAVKSYVALQVRLLFDPPQSSYMMNEMNDKATELAFRMNVEAEKSILYPADMSGIYVDGYDEEE